MSEPVLLFGIGAAKAGTSWLYRTLAAHPDCALRSIKELHFFDTVDDRRARDFYLGDLDRKAAAVERRLAAPEGQGQAGLILHLDDLRACAAVLRSRDEAAYLSYLTAGCGTARVVGDITPAYALLPAHRLAHMARLARDVRLVYLMRDPVDRLWSHVRMIARRRSADDDRAAAALAEVILDRVLSGGEDHITLRGDYRGVIEKLAEAVAPERSFICTCEDLFEGTALAALWDFLGIAPLPGDALPPAHRGFPARMRPDQKARAADFLRPQYDFVADRMGRLPPAWIANMAGGLSDGCPA
jgi:hypothetical protein